MSDAIPSAPPRDLTPLLALERARLLELLDGLGADDWRRPTPCPGWSVLDLAAHLLGDDLEYLAGHRDGHRGTTGPDPVDEDGFIDWLDRLQDDWVLAARRLSPPLVVELLRWTGPQLVDVVAGQDPAERAAAVSWAGTGPVPRWLDHGRELTERWIHRQQLLQALDRPSDRRDDLLVPVLDILRWAYPHRLGRHPRPPGASVAVVVVGPTGEVVWRLVGDGERWTFAVSTPTPTPTSPLAPTAADDDDDDDDDEEEEEAAEPVATLSMTDEQAWRLLSNNLDVAVHGRPATAGDPELVEVLVMTRAIIGRPNPVR